MFPTPLQGADSSPSAWGVDGTLLNGGGYGFNSFGSHKRYTYEWPQSSSPETAQMMKSYRDGTYGRGLLYFLEPGIYRTNILPAHWADPSMSLNSEAPSLVYGVGPIAVATSGGEDLALPISSAQYDLSTTPAQTIPTPDSSVFIPVPEGHTLFLGAFYSGTGTGGVFATPVNSNGTLGTAVRLTEKPNSDTTAVTDRFSGDIRGVRLWIGRLDSTPSSVTIAAMAGRLIESEYAVGFTPWTEEARNLQPNPSFETTIGLYNAGLNCTIARTTGSSTVGSYALEQTVTATGRSYVWESGPTTGVPVTAGLTYYVSAAFRALVGLRPMDIGIVFRDAAGAVPWPSSYGPAVTPAVIGGGYRVSHSAVAPVGAVRMQIVLRSNTAVVGDIYKWDAIMQSSSNVPYIDGSMVAPDEYTQYRWLGTVGNSASVKEVRTQIGNPAKQAKLVAGPWIGGQGHSGCRFAGTPSYVTNSPIEGGRVGFAASFIETGSWTYG